VDWKSLADGLNAPYHTATPCNFLQHPATSCNTLQQQIQVEWESLADDLMLQDWKEEQVADMERVMAKALVRDGSVSLHV